MEIAAPILQQISAEETYQIRSEVLRPGKPVSECHFETDFLKSTFHLGIFENKDLVGVASYMENQFSEFKNPFQIQLRGMAILPSARGNNYGKKLLMEAEKILKNEKEAFLIWFNARELAVKFYQKNGYKTFGNYFMIPNVCQHIVMFKEIQK